MDASFILVVNAGSATLKCALYKHTGGTLKEEIDFHFDQLQKQLIIKTHEDEAAKKTAENFSPGEPAHFFKDALEYVVDAVHHHLEKAPLCAVGHRVVHGGHIFKKPTIITQETFRHMKALEPLAPLHQPYNLEGAIYCAALFKDIPQIACFDTSFHQNHPPVADLYGLPYDFYEQGIRRYGFHGLSYEYIASYLKTHHAKLIQGQVIVAHLGSGASLCAMQGGRSVDSTLGFTALDGLPMGTRPGQMDPGILLYLLDQGLTPPLINDILYKKSGLLGISGISSDMRLLEASNEPKARLAIDYFVHRVTREIGGLVVSLGGLDGLVFTAGIGENSAYIRGRIIEQLRCFGLFLDDQENEAAHEIISSRESTAPILVIPTNEQEQIAYLTLHRAQHS
ncbi:MAG: acetate/propionate family kinase [Candidatus Nucleicultricaceae bacterium]